MAELSLSNFDMSRSVSVNNAVTDNGALSYATTGDARLDLFGKINRDIPVDTLNNLLAESWKVSPIDTVRIIFNLRDCRGGKGERKQFFACLDWLIEHYPYAVQFNMEHIPFYGRYKDWLYFLGTFFEKPMINMYCNVLKDDLQKLKDGGSVSLAAKYSPTENGHHDKRYKAVRNFTNELGISKKEYRTVYLVPLRNKIDILEHHMTNNTEDWDSIDLSKIPSVAVKKYKKSLSSHLGDKYTDWLRSIKEGKSKINVSRLMPYEMVEPLTNSKHDQIEIDTINIQWSEYVKQMKSNVNLSNAISVIDVSGSMTSGSKPLPIDVAISLGILTSEMCQGMFHRKFITFSEKPVIETLQGDNLNDQVNNINSSNVGLNTNIQAVFDVLLSTAVMWNVKPDEMPDTVFIFSDMQFDQCEREGKTNWEVIRDKYSKAGYTQPRMIFWNLSGRFADFPVQMGDPNSVYMSGFSADMFKIILEGGIPTPIDMLRKILDSDRYLRLKV